MAEVFEVMLRGGVRGSDVQDLTVFHLPDFISNFPDYKDARIKSVCYSEGFQ